MAQNTPMYLVNLAIAQDVSAPYDRIKTLEQDFAYFEIEFGETSGSGTTPINTDATNSNTLRAEGVKDSDGLYWEMEDVIIQDLPVDQWYGFRFRVMDIYGNASDWSVWKYNQVGDIAAPGNDYSENVVRYSGGNIVIVFKYAYSTAGNEDIAKHYIEVTETTSGEVTYYDMPIPSTSDSYLHSKTFQSVFGETFTFKIKAVDYSDNANASWFTLGSIVFPEYLQALPGNADVFHFDKMGYGSARGIYPTTIDGFPQLRGNHFSKFGGVVEFAESTTNVGRNPLFQGSTSWSPTLSGGGNGTTTYSYDTMDFDLSMGSGVSVLKNDGGTGQYGINQSNAAWNGVEHSFSFYYKVLSADAGAVMKFYGNTTLSSTSLDSKVIGEWQRFTNTTSNAVDIRYIWIEGADAHVVITGWQAEAKSYATPFCTLPSYSLSGDQTTTVKQRLAYPTATLVGIAAGSISYWYTPDFDSDISGMADPNMFSIFTSGTDRFFFQYGTTDDKFRVYMHDGTATDIKSSVQTFSRGDRIFIAVTWDDTNVKLYVSGVLEATGTVRAPTLASTFSIGGASSSFDNQINGCLDEMIFWKGRTLTASEVAALHELGVPNLIPNVIRSTAPVVKPASDFIYDQPASQGQLSDDTWTQLNSRTTVREVN